ncbi:hypothetical protein [Boudabousia marimammalium]|uniref:Uncharacterized protein n=1 Tax=Boudabousia marimammalium TaxID=156892 RepID=A0A1Q5PSC8_9ACTO|nr:hypothetical protein [Boudabousia marimammalium]OKL50466.1 hypothetical protein BM477_00370 [Boudabousia marimammalium]
MKLFELADTPHPLVPRGLAHAPYLRELISMFTTVTEAEWVTRAGPYTLPSDATLERIALTDKVFTKKLAKAITARWRIKNFVTMIDGLELETQQLITANIASYGERVRLDRFPDDVARLLVEIFQAKAGTDNGKIKVLADITMQAARMRYEKLLLARSRGCAKCGRPLGISSHDRQADSDSIMFLDSDEDGYTADDFAALYKPYGKKYEFRHTPQDIAELCRSNVSLLLNDQVDECACGVVVSFLTQICDLFKPRRQIL